MQVNKNIDTWVMAGQSNMQGCGKLEGALPPDDRVWSFVSAGKWEVASEPLHRLWESFTPVHKILMRPGLIEDQAEIPDDELARMEAETRIAGAGLGLSFGKAMADALGRPVGLIPAAHGGTSLEQWSYKLKSEGGESLYGAMLERIDRAGGNLQGVLWYQGESDCWGNEAITYEERFDEWVSSLRSDLGLPELPVIVVQLGRFVCLADPNPLSCWDDVREAQRTLPERTPHTAVTSAIDLGLDDVIHIGAAGMIRLGRRMARLAIQMMESPNQPAGPRVVRVERCKPFEQATELCVVCNGVTGGWNPSDHIGGFELRTDDNKPHPEIAVINAKPDTSDPRNIRVMLNGCLDDTMRIAYGLDINPYCNAVDQADMPLCAFSPMAVGNGG